MAQAKTVNLLGERGGDGKRKAPYRRSTFVFTQRCEQVYNCLIEIESDGTCRGIRVFLDLPIEVDYRQKLLSKS